MKPKTPNPKHPIQPLVMDGSVVRFKVNPLVRHLLDFATPRGCSMNELARMTFPAEDRQHFAQLIGYSLSGYGELSYVDDVAYGAAATMMETGKDERDARIAYLESTLKTLKDDLRKPIAALYGRHPDDLT